MTRIKVRKKPQKGCSITFFLILIILIIAVFLTTKLPPVLYPTTYSNEVEAAARANDLDPMLIFALIKAESNFQTDAVSKSGAVGLTQLMPDTARWIAKKMDLHYNDAKLRDVKTNIKMGAWYLSYLLERFDGDINKALVAYNAGYANVQNWIKKGVWDGTVENSKNIPYVESRDYLRRVLANYDKYKSLYGRPPK